MSKPGKKTAAEFLAELGGNLDLRRRERDRDRERAEREAEYARLEKPLLEQLGKIGVDAVSLADLVARHSPLRQEIVGVLRTALGQASDEGLQEAIVRALAASRESFPGDELLRLFESTRSETLRWAIANTLAEARPSVDFHWLADRLADPREGKAREMLTLALARRAPLVASLPILRSVLTDIPGHVAMALAEVGTLEDAALLREQLPASKGWVRKEIEKAIRRIERRAE
jgi:hypothetical protein